MRSIINISIPAELNKIVGQLAKKGNYATKSEFVRELIRERIGEENLYVRIQKGEAEFQAGKGKVLRSLADLD